MSWDPKTLPVSRAVGCNLLEDDESAFDSTAVAGEAPEAAGAVPAAPALDGTGRVSLATVDPGKGFLLVDFTPFQVISLKLFFS